MISLSEIYVQVGRLPLSELNLVCLYGSFARGDAHETSDVDLWIVTQMTPSVSLREKLNASVREMEEDLKRKVDLVVTGPRETDLPPDLRAEVLADSVILYGRGLMPSPEKGDLVAYRLIAYETSGLDSLTRVRLSRELFGYATQVRHGRKKYRYRREGAVFRAGGFRVDLSVFLCPAGRSGEILKSLRKSKAGYTDRLIYLESFQNESHAASLGSARAESSRE